MAGIEIPVTILRRMKKNEEEVEDGRGPLAGNPKQEVESRVEFI